MEFDKAYSRPEFLKFLKGFLPTDTDLKCTEEISFYTKMKFATSAVKLGANEELDLKIFEVRHTSKNDARVGLSKDAFRMMAEEGARRALVIFVPEDSNANYRFSFIELTLDWDEGAKIKKSYSNPRRYSYYLGEGIAYYTPNKFLNEKGRITSVEDLRSRFSVEVLTKTFYTELAIWYAWALTQIQFPNDIKDEEKKQQYIAENIIRLVTRLIFVWFLKQKHLVPDEFFDEKFISDHLLKDFQPNKKENLFGMKSLESKYYKAILQNLFFAMLNCPITKPGKSELTERGFRKEGSDFDNNKLMRHKALFKDPDLFVELANKTVPFLNGGLFDCLDIKDKGIYIDAFTDRDNIIKKLIIPDFLFFGDKAGQNLDLYDWFGEEDKKKVSSIGIIDILKKYNFTVEENTPFDQEVSLDPELLGKVFENLLASYNPETKMTARKQTGSFYTPRDIVQYMVDESLIAHLNRTVRQSLEPQFRTLLKFDDTEIELSSEQKEEIINSLYKCKVLDPACGSGAFPMGMLQQMVHILSRLDPENIKWKEIIKGEALKETGAAYDVESKEEREDYLREIERSFDEGLTKPDYARKLYLIENCIFGVDIQPIAIQISKLRFFISLVVDQDTNNNPADNFGIRPLPNLEANFVAANSLIPLSFNKDKHNLDYTKEVESLREKLKEASHKIFNAKTYKTKKKWRSIFEERKEELKTELKRKGFLTNEGINQIDSWDPFDQNSVASFFDPKWMFGEKDGFDIVIANPPFIDSETMVLLGMEEEREFISHNYSFISGNWDIYMAFLELGIKLNVGFMCYITPDKWLSKPFGELFRENCMSKKLKIITHAGNDVFENVRVDAIISLFAQESSEIQAYIFNKNKELDKRGHILTSDLKSPYIIDSLFSPFASLIRIMDSKSKNKIEDIALCENSCATNEAYKLVPLIKSSIIGESYKLVNTGTIDKFASRWGHKEIVYLTKELGYRPLTPYVPKKEFESQVGNAYSKKAKGPKIIIKGLNLLDAFVDVEGIYLPGKTTLVINLPNDNLLYFLGSIINSSYAIFYLKTKYSSSSYCGGITFTKNMINKLPIPEISKQKKNKLIENSKKATFLRSDNPSMDISEILKENDKILFSSFGFSYQDILLIDPKTSITEEEYKNFKID